MFRITKNIHNILQGVSHPDQRISAEEKQAIIDWITDNANRYWFSEGGPLRSPEEGGADVVIVSQFSPFPPYTANLPPSCMILGVRLLHLLAHDHTPCHGLRGGGICSGPAMTRLADERRLMTPKCRV